MIVAVVSGKGGTGKTTIATGLALSLTQDGLLPILIDCDVENPNAGLFLTPTIQTRHSVSQPIPQVDAELCTLSGRCSEVCQFHAILPVGESVLVFSNLCHSCGSCILNCPTNAIEEVLHSVGQVDSRTAQSWRTVRGPRNPRTQTIGSTSPPHGAASDFGRSARCCLSARRNPAKSRRRTDGKHTHSLWPA